MNEEPATPATPDTDKQPTDAHESHEPAKSSVNLPTSVLALGFIAIALVGVLIATAIKSRPADSAAADTTTEDPAIREAKAKLQMLQSSLNQDRAKLGLSPLYGDTTQSAEIVADRITEDAATLVAMAKGVKDLIATKDAELAQRTQEWTDAVKLQGVLRDQLAKAEERLSRALLDGSDAADLRAKLEIANQRIIALGDEIRRLGEGPADLQARLQEITAERDSLLARVAELESQLSRASLFAGTEAELYKEAIELVRSLRALENKSDSEINIAYSQFAVKLGSSLIGKVDFPTGLSDIAPDVATRIESFPADAPDNALILVIGYASETGNVDNNRTLSSDRATAVAGVLDKIKKPGQRVQAVYLGQTDRFGSSRPERNQISEVWQIVPKAN
jgi:outer membrane protein OmpA-like peptidoglycan-associated protein